MSEINIDKTVYPNEAFDVVEIERVDENPSFEIRKSIVNKQEDDTINNVEAPLAQTISQPRIIQN